MKYGLSNRVRQVVFVRYILRGDFFHNLARGEGLSVAVFRGRHRTIYYGGP